MDTSPISSPFCDKVYPVGFFKQAEFVEAIFIASLFFS